MEIGSTITFWNGAQLFFMNYLNQATFLPLLGLVVILFIPATKQAAIKAVALIACFLSFVASILAWTRFVPDLSGMQFPLDLPWIGFHQLQIHYTVGIDGLSMPLFLLTTFISLVACLGSFGIANRVKEYFIFYLLLAMGMLGVFISLDYFLFYVFWEVMLVPMYFLIGIWGGPRKEYAAIKFFLYTLFGSIFMLLSIIAIWYFGGQQSFNILDLAASGAGGALKLQPLSFKFFAFLGFFLGFAIKVPMFPFHTWLPDAHVEAPTAVSVILAGVLLKMGTYGFLRVSLPTFPEVSRLAAPFIAILALIGIIYGALVAMAQPDLKKLVAYSSVSHMGYIVLGIFGMTQDGINGAIMYMVAHGLTTGGLFLLVGVIYDRAHTRIIKELGGLGVTMPKYTGIMSVITFGSLGLPGLVGFWGEFMIIKGTFINDLSWAREVVFGSMTGATFFRIAAIIAGIGMILTAAYLLWMIERVFLGKENPRWKGLKDMTAREYWSLAPIAALVVVFGVYPTPILNMFNFFATSISQFLLSRG